MTDEVPADPPIVTSPAAVATAPAPNGAAPARKRLTREEILAAPDLSSEDVDIPEWGGAGAYVTVRGLTGHERDAWEAGMWANVGTKKARMTLEDTRASLVQKTVVDESGALLFSRGDIDRLTQKSAAPLHRIFTVAQRLSGISDNDVEEIAEDLKGDPSAGAGLTSP